MIIECFRFLLHLHVALLHLIPSVVQWFQGELAFPVLARAGKMGQWGMEISRKLWEEQMPMLEMLHGRSHWPLDRVPMSIKHNSVEAHLSGQTGFSQLLIAQTGKLLSCNGIKIITNLLVQTQKKCMQYLCLRWAVRSDKYKRGVLFSSSEVATIYLIAYQQMIINSIIHFRIYDHPRYSRLNYDFSLLRLKNGFNLPSISNVAPACLPSIARPQNVDVQIVLLYCPNILWWFFCSL